jgi:tetratricopeptide (TPR) repeat protein
MQRIYVTALALVFCPYAGFARDRVAVIGVRDYTADASTKPVRFADNDAGLFGSFAIQKALDPTPVLLTFPAVEYQRNGVRARSQVANLITIEHELSTLFGQAEPRDTIYLFVSARGMAWPSLEGYLGTIDMVGSKPQSGGLPLRFLRQLIEGSHVGRVIIFADVSRKPGEVFANDINRRVAELGGIPKVAGVLATQPRQVSEEKENPQPGRGFFGQYLVTSGAAGAMNLSALYLAVRKALESDPATKGKQTPADFGAPPAKNGLLWRASLLPEFEEWPHESTKPPVLVASTKWFAGLLAFQQPSANTRAASVRAELERSGPVRDPQALVDAVKGLRSQLSEEERQDIQTLAIERLAGDAQRPVNRYGMQNLLPEDPLRVKPEEFKKAAEEFSAALQILPESFSALYQELYVRQLLCEGLSGKTVAIDPLNTAERFCVKMSRPVIPEVHNAIGIYYLESTPKDYDQAIREFTDAKKASPGWIYPRHNLALALIEKGNYAQAEREYRDAIASQPLQPYVYYNLGLLLHRMNRRPEAKVVYQQARDVYDKAISELQERLADWQGRLPEDAGLVRERIDLFKISRAEILNSWGVLLASSHDVKGAREKYGDALDINGDLCPARDNWAKLEQSVAERQDRNSVSNKAVDLLDQNLARPACAEFHPSLLQRARLRRKQGDLDGAKADLERVLKLVSSNTEALTGLADIQATNLEYEPAIQSLNKVIAIEAQSGGVYPAVYAQLAEVYRRAKNPAACLESYGKAIAATPGAVSDVSIRELRKRSTMCGQ